MGDEDLPTNPTIDIPDAPESTSPPAPTVTNEEQSISTGPNDISPAALLSDVVSMPWRAKNSCLLQSTLLTGRTSCTEICLRRWWKCGWLSRVVNSPISRGYLSVLFFGPIY